jgi:hypothetical protein
MPEEQPLYRDSQIEIGFNPNSPEDHYIKFIVGGEKLEFLIQRGILRELARNNRDEFQSKIDMVDEMIGYTARERKLTYSDMHVAIIQAYMEEESRRDNFVRTLRI